MRTAVSRSIFQSLASTRRPGSSPSPTSSARMRSWIAPTPCSSTVRPDRSSARSRRRGRSARSVFGPLQAGRAVDIAGHRMTIGGVYELGTGFLGLGIALASEANFFRMFPERPPDTVNLGLVSLKPDADPDRAAQALRAILPADMQVFTRPELVAHEVAYWTTRTATGLIFGSGLVVSFVVGILVLDQTLAPQITRQLPQFATLKAIGYTNRYLNAIVMIESFLVMLV